MPMTMALWWFGLRDHLLFLLELLTRPIVESALADKVVGLESANRVWFLRTSLSPIDNPVNLLGIPISTNRFTISYALLWGLILATPNNKKLKQLILGTAILIPATIVIALLLIQFKLALNINHQPILTEVPQGAYLLALPYSDSAYYLMAVGRQLALLVFPSLLPLVIWGLLNRPFIRIVLFEGLLTRNSDRPMSFPSATPKQDTLDPK